MTKQQFETALKDLAPRRREVLELFLAGESDEAIAKSLYITTNTVRQHIMNICLAFGLESSQRVKLILLFVRYKPELLNHDIDQLLNLHREYDPNFVGREGAIADLDNLINNSEKLIALIAQGGTGKTTLAKKYLTQKYGDRVLIFQLAKETQNFGSVESLIEEKLRQLGEEPGRDFNVSLERLKSKLQTQEMGVLIDNIEPGLDGKGQFIKPHRQYVELLRIFNDEKIKGITLITSREELHEPSIKVCNYKLEGLSLEAWQEYFNYKKVKTNTEKNELVEIHKAFGGNAKAMDVICQAIITDFEGDLEQYWLKNQENLLIESTLENLIKEQFKRLKEINLNDAYNLLCRMGCYRYQDVPTVPELGLISLLWDVSDKKQHQKIIKVLKERGLVEFNKGEYWLHPVIREEAIERLKNSKDWETANIKAAEFWTESVKTVETVKDALTAFEAYHHYLEINNYQLAASIIVKARTIQWQSKKDEQLGRAFFRLGLLQPMKLAIIQIVNKLEDSYNLGQIYNILGDICWSVGDLHKAIEFHEKSRQIAVNFSVKYLEIVSFFNIGLCYIDMGEIEIAITFFEKCLLIIEEPIDKRHTITCFYSLAFLNACLGFKEKSFDFVDKVLKELDTTGWTTWSIGYRDLFLGKTYTKLMKLDKSFSIYMKAINFANQSNYPLVKAIGLTGIAELYRIQNDLTTALDHHQESIEILEKIDAKCDLAEAYFQLALTYQKMGDQTNSETYFNKALNLWGKDQIDAPKQIERVLDAMNSQP